MLVFREKKNTESILILQIQLGKKKRRKSVNHIEITTQNNKEQQENCY